MLRIHFTPADLGRVRLVSSPDPLWEVVFSLFRLRQRGLPLAFQRWRRDAGTRANPAALSMLMPMTPGGYYPDFLTPAQSAAGLEAGLDAILSTGRARVKSEMRLHARGGPLPPSIRPLAGGDAGALRKLTEAIRVHYRAVIEPYWAQAQVHVDADRARRTKLLLDGGCEAMLSGFGPLMRWHAPVLEVNFPVEQDIHLDGRGLTLIPSFFSHGDADALYDTSLPPVLVFPLEHDLALSARTGENGDRLALEALIGQTRTYVLGEIDDGATTSELARRIGVSAGSISQHTSVLREAGLILTTRTGKAVIHTLTPLGRELLNAT